jgi:hypothetical protein
MKLGTLLLRNAAIGLSQLESALRNQVLYGGRLGTNLVELGFLDLELLSAYLAELSGLPIATPTLLEDIDRELADRLGSEAAHRLRAIPLGRLEDRAASATGAIVGSIAVALVEPTNPEILDELARRLEASITPYVVPELRALYYLEKHFGLPRRPRFVRTARPGSETDAAAERRRSHPAHGMVMPPAFTLEPRRRRASQAPPPVTPVEIELTLEAARARIEAASHREAIGDTFVELAKGRFDVLVVFLVRDGNALGWRGHAAHGNTIDFAGLSLPLGGSSALQTAHDTRQPYVGPPPAPAKPIESQLWNALGIGPEPPEVAVVPVLVKQRPVNLIYAHSLTPLEPGSILELTDLAERAATSYLRLIRQARGS